MNTTIDRAKEHLLCGLAACISGAFGAFCFLIPWLLGAALLAWLAIYVYFVVSQYGWLFMICIAVLAPVILGVIVGLFWCIAWVLDWAESRNCRL